MLRHLYKYVSAEVAEIILTTGRIRFSSPLSFNDLFDTQHDFRFGFSDSLFVHRYREELLELVNGDDKVIEHPENVPMQGIQELRGFREDPDELERQLDNVAEFARDQLRQLVEQKNHDWHAWVSNLRVLCLARGNRDLVMWSHYSDSHRGAVIELGRLQDGSSLVARANPVLYSPHPPVAATLSQLIKRLTGQGGFEDHEAFDRYLLTKSDRWQYEAEMRIVYQVEENAPEFLDLELAPGELTGIYLGYRCSEEDGRSIADLRDANFPDARLSRARKTEFAYGIEFEAVE